MRLMRSERGDLGIVVMVLFLAAMQILIHTQRHKIPPERTFGVPGESENVRVYTTSSVIDFVEHIRFEKFISGSTGELLYIRINSFGGDAFAGFLMIESMKDYLEKYGKDKIECYVPLEAYSMAAIMALNCPKLGMGIEARLMFHSGRVFYRNHFIRAKDIDETDPKWRGWLKVKKYLLALDKIQEDVLQERTGLDRHTIVESLTVGDRPESGWYMNRYTACQYKIVTECGDL